jgi:HSP20 family molecular chaperone IbpA
MEKARLSAKWRRNKKHADWSKVFKTMKRTEGKRSLKTFRVRNIEIQKRTRPNKLKLMKVGNEKGWKEPEPLVDVLQEKDEVIVVAEVAGFKKENVKIHVENQRLILSANASDRKYYKSLNLPIGVISDKIRTKHKNGVLEIRLKKSVEEKTVDRVAR